jgi:uncharacterized protein (TIGR03435 family)
MTIRSCCTLRDQLGLRIESKKTPTDIIVVDRAERPGDN